ncbi:MAG: FAD-binding protein, partial [Lachnospiraceae bacterium]|nr:FAD-binding protein [Lachnospiraceae bacterium]
MKDKKFTDALARIAAPGALLFHEPMCAHTTFRVGGPADCYVEVSSAEKLKELISFLASEQEPFFVLGNGSNLLVSDDGYRGTILSLSKHFARIEVLPSDPQ